MDSYYINLSLKEAKKAYFHNEVPVGAVLVNNNIVVKGYNKKYVDKISTRHAEIIVIEKMCKKINDWRLDNCVLYVTLQPCLMCVGAIIESRIKKVVFGCWRESVDNSYLKLFAENNIEVVFGIEESECSNLLKKFFKDRRK